MSRSKETKRRANGCGRVYKVKDTYYLQYSTTDGKRKSITLRNEQGEKITEEREAQQAARKYLDRENKIKEIETRI